MKVLVVNAVSSSLKYQLMDTTTEDVLAKGICERLGMAGSLIEHKKADGTKIKKEIPMDDHSIATEIVVNMLTDKEYGCISSMDEIEAVGHRVVHGGPYISDSCLVTDEVMSIIEKCIEFAPLHNPAHIMGIKGCQKVMPKTPQVAVLTQHSIRQWSQRLIHMLFQSRWLKRIILEDTVCTAHHTSLFLKK
jgi:acetate kinase